MHLSRLASLVIILLFVSSFTMISTIAAEETIDNLVTAEFHITFLTGTDLYIEITIDATKLTTDQVYNAEGIKSASEQELGAFRLLLFQMLDRQLDVTFENAEIKNFTMPTFDGEHFNEELNIGLTPSFFGLSDSVNPSNFINGALDMGAIVNYSLDLHAEPGWNNTYLVGLSQGLGFKRTTGSLEGDDIRWTVRNWNGEYPDKIAEFQIERDNPTTPSLDSEDIDIEFILDSRDAKHVSLENNIVIRGADIRIYDILPDFITTLDFIPADGIRLLVDNGFITWDDCYEKTLKPVEEKIIDAVDESSFNQTLDVVFSWYSNTTSDCLTPYETSNMNNKPAVKAALTDDRVSLKIFDISSRALFGLINSGAEANISEEDINFGDNLKSIGYDYNITLYLPDSLYLDNENTYVWNGSNPISGGFESEVATSYSNEDKSTVIEIEVKNTDLNLISFFTGKTELTFEIDTKQTRNYNVTTLPDAFTLPEKISIEYLNSDAFRLCVEENVFDEERITTFLNSEKTHFESLLRKTLPGLKINGNINRGVFDGSLILWDGNILEMDAYPPVKTESYAHSSYPITFDLSFLPPSVNIPPKTFNLSGLPNQDVTYRIIFPHGISISANDPLGKTDVKKTGDGRFYLEATFSASESDLTMDVSCKMTPSALFIIGIFMPCIISLIIAIVLIIVIYIIRKKRKGKKESISIVDEEDLTGYEDEDYYVPPPPNSK